GPLNISFSNVKFSYPRAEEISLASLESVAKPETIQSGEILKGISFEVPAGTLTALVGSSGAGKTTISALLPRLYDVTDGAISINGDDIRDLQLQSLRDAIDALCADKLMQTLRIADQALSRLLGRKPALLLAALNPHAGEAGAFGREEIELLSPCVAEAQAQGILIEGPLAADSVFARAWNNPQIDAVIALYHDQGLIPIKLLGMDLGVNITLGLPFVRTSPDHGTAFDIAGKGIAREASLLAALKAADHYSLKQAYEHGAEGASAVQS
ncbi:MAG: ATP-binding cassette domain-containing protein, partial [Betaproteobacteria bacterium]|nr:ATP-binding cassette domain-containing protein [Betaproteobacteria bacterium]